MTQFPGLGLRVGQALLPAPPAVRSIPATSGRRTSPAVPTPSAGANGMRCRLVQLALLAALVPACGKSTPPAPPPANPAEGLKELGDVYKYRAGQRLPPPARIEDLFDQEPSLPNAWPSIQDGRIVVVWKAGYAPGSSDVLAYEKDAPASGGQVLLRNGTVKQMTADQFRAAKPK